MSTRSRATPWFRRRLTAAQLRLAAEFQFGFDFREEPLDSALLKAEMRFWKWDAVSYSSNAKPYEDPYRQDAEQRWNTIAQGQMLDEVCALADRLLSNDLLKAGATMADFEMGPKFAVGSTTIFDEESQSYRITWTLTPSKRPR